MFHLGSNFGLFWGVLAIPANFGRYQILALKKKKSYLLLLVVYLFFFFFFSFFLFWWVRTFLLFLIFFSCGFRSCCQSTFPFLFVCCTGNVCDYCQPPSSFLNAISFVLNFLFILFLPAHTLLFCHLCFKIWIFSLFCFCEPHMTNNKNECSNPALTLFHCSNY